MIGRRCIVGISGGVDSSVSALIMKEKYKEVIGVFMQNWDPGDESGNSYTCPVVEDYKHAKEVCHEIGIPLHKVDFIQDYWNKVFEPYIDCFKDGGTPNPDVFCNKEIKFKSFANFVRKEFGQDSLLATGHYANLRTDAFGNIQLIKAKDQTKDQTYFLCAVAGEDLRNVVFPVGNLLKTQVRQIAKEHGLCTASRKDSVGICFIGKRKFPDFISEYVEPLPGRMLGEDGHYYGQHASVHHFTIGQKARVGGLDERLFVADKNMQTGDITVVRGQEHPALFSAGFTVKANQMFWVSRKIPQEVNSNIAIQAKIRHRQEPMHGVIRMVDDGSYRIDFDTPGKAITSQQICAFYNGDICLGGGIIDRRIL